MNVPQPRQLPPTEAGGPWGDKEVVELPLLLPPWQAAELERQAWRLGLTVGQMLRRLVGDLLRKGRGPASS